MRRASIAALLLAACGSAPVASTGTSASCDRIAADYAQAFVAASACDPAAVPDRCTQSWPAELGALGACEATLDPARTASLGPLRDAFREAACSPTVGVLCPNFSGWRCVATPTGGRCAGQP